MLAGLLSNPNTKVGKNEKFCELLMTKKTKEKNLRRTFLNTLIIQIGSQHQANESILFRNPFFSCQYFTLLKTTFVQSLKHSLLPPQNR